jgi:hypothetical protein
MSNRIPTENGPNSTDSAYADMRQRPIITRMGIQVGDTVQSPHGGDTWRIEGIARDRATIRHMDTFEVSRVYDSWFKSVELAE